MLTVAPGLPQACHKRHSRAGQHAQMSNLPTQKEPRLAALSTNKDCRRGGRPENKAVWWSGPMNATCATSAARVQQIIRRNKRLISGSMRILTASEARLSEGLGWV
eukprot:scaffold58322_cov67-Phaeocystis_antarctica.AAC.11